MRRARYEEIVLAREQQRPHAERVPKLCGFEVQGHSIGGLDTCIDLPELRLCFDIGRGPDFALARNR